MKTEESKTIGDMVNELSESYADLARAMKGVAQTANATKQLWRNEKRSWLIKAGLALIAFPDPTISDVVGTAMVAAGLVQERIRRQTLHVDDVYKTFQNTLKEVRNTRESL
jgi:hypothetical protein